VTELGDADLVDLLDAADQERLLVEGAQVGLLLQDAEGTIVRANPVAARALGVLPETLRGRGPYDPSWRATDADGRPLAPEQYPVLRALATGVPVVALIGLERVDGEATIDGHPRRTWVEVRCRPLFRPGEQRPFGAVSTVLDATRRHVAESQLRAAETRFQRLLQHAAIGIGVLHPDDGSWVAVNAALCRLLGYSEEQLLNTPVASLVSPAAYAAAVDAFQQLRHGVIGHHESEAEVRRQDGSTIWTSVSSTFVRREDGTPDALLLQVVDISERRRAHAELAHRAMHDPLTGLPNRIVLMDRLEHALTYARRERRNVGVLFLDLDDFKSVNDTYGHDVGDELLRQVAERLRDVSRSCDTVVRLGGDEFVVLCEGSGTAEGLRAFADRLTEALARPYPVAGLELRTTASVGVTTGDGPDSAALLRRADAAMYRRKQRRRGAGAGPAAD
jgi:diguanylate cyclase (GGDEF)-like protein/PAS domain S-box-containing protein